MMNWSRPLQIINGHIDADRARILMLFSVYAICLIGDLVAKGPSSEQVIRLAMDIGALSVRGNHDHEVVRQGVAYLKEINHRKVLDRLDEVEQVDQKLQQMRKHSRVDQIQHLLLSELNDTVNSIVSVAAAVDAKESGTLFDGSVSANQPWVNSSSDDVQSLAGMGSSAETVGSTDNLVNSGLSVATPQGTPSSPSPTTEKKKGAATRGEHLRIALKLSLKEFDWLAQLPFYIKSIDLGTLFVHAGFVNGVRLNEQDYWDMMAMRSILPDGKSSTKCFSNHPWAAQWAGPLTVLFGHDAARGLQVYENAYGLDTGTGYMERRMDGI